ncbi:MAG: hypothetical protein V4457_05925 [Pseudomonadota bacterium]
MARRVIGGLVNHATGTPLGPYKDVDSLAKQLEDHNANYEELYNAIGLGGIGVVTDAVPGAGSITGYSPIGFTTATTVLVILADDTGTQINDLPIGASGQRVRVINGGAVGDLTLTDENAGSTAAKRFSGSSDMPISAGDCVDILYVAGSINRWTM